MKSISALSTGGRASALLVVLSITLGLSVGLQAATRTWDGGGDGQSWNNATNWVGDALPAAADDVVISSNGFIVVASGNITVKSVQCAASLLITNGNFTVTNGVSFVNESFMVAPGRAFTASGTNTTFVANGSVLTTNAELYVSSGARAQFPTLTEATGNNVAFTGRRWQAQGAGSVLEFPALTNLVGCIVGYSDFRVWALTGGRVLMTNLTTIPQGSVWFRAENTNSLVDLSQLTSHFGAGTIFEARSGGTVLIPLLETADGTTVHIFQNGTIPTAQITSMTNGGVFADGAFVDLPALTNLHHSSITLQNGGTANLSNVVNLDGSDVYVRHGVTLAFPALTSYAFASAAFVAHWLQAESGGVIDFSSVTNFIGAQVGYSHLNVRAYTGGRIELPGVTTMPPSYIYVYSESVGSVVNFSNLTVSPRWNSHFEARAGGTLRLDALQIADELELVIRQTNSLLPTAQIVSLSNTVVTADASAPNFSGVTNLTLASLYAGNGGALAFPNVREYPALTLAFQSRTFRADGVGSLIDLSAITNFSGNVAGYSQIYVQAVNGGRILLNNVTFIPASSLDVRSEGAGSQVDFSALTGTAVYNSLLQALNGGTINIPSLTDPSGFTVVAGAGSTLPTTQFRQIINGGISAIGRTVDLSGVTNLSGSTITVDTGGVLLVPNVTMMDGANVFANNGAMVTFPSVQGYRNARPAFNSAEFRATGAGSTINFPALTYFLGSTNGYSTHYLRAWSGGRIRMNNVAHIPPSNFEFDAEGTNGFISMTSLVSMSGGSSYVEARNGGTNRFSTGPLSVTNVTITLRTNSTLMVGGLTLGPGSILQGAGIVPGNLINAGSIRPGINTVAGAITAGSFTQTTNGALYIDIGGTNSGLHFDTVSSLGGVTLDGYLEARLINGYAPATNLEFRVVTASALSGVFGSYAGLNAGANIEFLPVFDATSASLKTFFSAGPIITNITPTGTVLDSLSSFTAYFNESLNFSSISSADVTLAGPNGNAPFSSVSFPNARTVTFHFTPQTRAGVYTLTVGPNINDAAGNLMNQDGDATNGEAGQDSFQSTVTLEDTAPPMVASVTPSGTVSNNVSSLAIKFNETLLAGTFTAADISLTGPAGAITLLSLTNPNTTNWTATFASQTNTGNYTFTIGPDVQDTQSNNMPAAFIGSFTIDRSGPSILSASPSGTLTQAVSHVDLTFSESLTATNFTPTDATLTGPTGAITINSVFALGGNVYRVTFAQQAVSGNYTLVVGPQITDTAGNRMNQDGDTVFGEATEDTFTNSFTVFSPDLVALNVAGPTNALPGETILVSWIVTNAGNAATSRAITEVVSLSTNGSVSNTIRIASFELTNALLPGAWLARTQSVTLPVNGPAGDLRLVVQTDANNQIPEGNEVNNFSLGETHLTMPLALTLQLDETSVTEGDLLSAVVARNGSSASPLTVNLNSTDAGELTAPATVTILAGQTEAAFNLTAITDSVADGSQIATIQASAGGFLSTSNTVTILDADIPNLALVITNFIFVEGQMGLGSVTRQGNLSAPLTVALGSSSPGQMSVSAAVTIPAGQSNAVFTILAVDDHYVESTRGYSITAGATNYGGASSTLTVMDDDQPTLYLSLDQTQVREGAGSEATTLTIARLADAVLPVQAQIISSREGDFIFSRSVTFNPGELVKLVPLSPVDDALIETNRTNTFTVQALETLSLNPLPGVSTNLVLLDDDGPSLQLTFARDWICGDTNSPLSTVVATLTRSGSLSNAVLVSLSANGSGLLNLPNSIVIANGSNTTNFNITLGAGTPIAPGESVTLTATATNLSSAVAALQRVTTCSPDLVIQSLTAPTNGLTDAYFSINYREINVGAGFAVVNQPPGVTNISQKVYLSTDPYPGDDAFLGAVTFNGSVNPYTFLDRNATLRLPSVPGNYWVIVEADGSNDVVEASEANNFFVSAQPIQVNAAYTATVTANVESAPAGTPIGLSGTALKFGTTQPAPFELVSLHIGLRGTTRIIAALTDGSGNFAATFTPLPGEAGTYTVGVSHPGITNNVPVQDSFTILGIRATPSTLALTIPALTTVTQQFTLANLGDTALNGVTTSVLGLPPEFSANATVSPSLLPFGNGTLSVVLGVVADTNLTRTFTVRVTSSEGAVANVTVTVTAESLRPRLVAAPASLTAGVVPGTQRFLEFAVINQGGAASDTLTIQPPAFSFLRVLSPPSLPPLAPGESNIVSLQLAPLPTETLGLYTGNLLVTDGVASLNMPLQFRIVSTNTGTLQVEVTDQFTYYAEGAPRVTNAVVEIKDPYTGTVLARRTNDATGNAIFTNLLEGYYTIGVTADEHAPFQTTLFVTAADTTYQEALLSKSTVQFFWTVTPTEIGDRTKISIEAVFETVVPVPVLTISPSVIDLADFPNGGSINLTITNHGLLAAQDTQLTFSEFECYRITPLISDIGTLAARSSITIPVAICHDATCSGNFSGCPAGGGSSGASLSVDKGRIRQLLQSVQNASSLGGGSSCGGGAVSYIIPCGDIGVSGGAPIGVANAGGSDCGGIGAGGSSGSATIGSGSGLHVGPGVGGGNCNPCALEMGGVLLECAIGFVLPPIPACIYGSYQCYTEPGALTCLSAGVSCLEVAGRAFPPLGGALSAIECANNIASACGGPGFGGLGGSGTSGLVKSGKNPTSNFAESLPEYPYPGQAEVALAGIHAQVVVGVVSNLFGGQQWLEAASGDNFGPWLTVLSESMANTSDTTNRISAAERALLLDHPLTNDLSVADINQFVDRWNRTVDYSAAGIYYSTNVPSGQSTDFIAFDIHKRHLDWANEAIQEAAALGFTNVFEELKIRVQQLRDFVFQPSSGVCAQVRLRIDQEAVIARDAFRASLEIVNDSSSALSNITVNLLVVNSAGEVVNPLFAIPAPALSGIANITGTGAVTPGTQGTVAWTIVPTTESATTSAEIYYVSGSIRYTQNGAATIVPLAAQSITVHPLAQLQLTYFHQRDVLGDDPFTDEVEPGVPYSLATMIRNTGFGTARNVRITSAQPQIIDNDKGLFIDFQIIATEVAGQNLLPSLTANFGDIAAGEIKIGRWLLKSTLQGLFTEYSATFEHLDDLGDPRASIIQSVEIKELIRIVSAPGIFQDNLPDMLVNDFADLEDLPDKLYLSDGGIHPVSIVTGGTVSGLVASNSLQVTLTASAPTGWSYLRVSDPGRGLFRLKQVIRADGVSLSLETNAWTTDRTFIGGGKKPILENNVHLLDYNSPGSYTLIYEVLPPTDTTAPTSVVAPLLASSFPQIPLTWSGNDAGSGLAWFDIYVSDNSGPFTRWLEHTPLFGAIYSGAQGHTYSFYSVAVDQAGNVESAPVSADATTLVNRTNSAPVLTVGTNVTVNEGSTVNIANSATDAEIDAQTLSFSLASGAPPNATINRITGQITWPTGEGTGPSTNVLGVIVTDSGSPALSSTGFVTVIVSEVNQTPVIASAGPFTINEGTLFSRVFTATDVDLPTNSIKWSLGSGAPSGAVIGTNSGLFTWTPTTLQGPSTNTIQIVATDNGQPALAGSRFITVIVRDAQGDFIFSVSSTNVFIGESNSVPLQLTAGVDLASVSFTLPFDDTRLTNLLLQNISPQVANASLVPSSSNRVAISLSALPGQTLPLGAPLASLAFQARTNAVSAFVRLQPIELLGQRTGGAVLTNGLARAGRIIVIGQDPLLEALPHSPRELALWSLPASSYRIEYVTTLGEGWQAWQTLTTATARTLVPAHDNATTVFYRAIVSP